MNDFAQVLGWLITHAHYVTQVFDGPTAQNNSRVGKHCGSNIPDPIISSGNSMVIHMVTDGSVSVEGFDITYIASSTGCGGTITSISGGFASPTARDPGMIYYIHHLVKLSKSKLQ